MNTATLTHILPGITMNVHMVPGIIAAIMCCIVLNNSPTIAQEIEAKLSGSSSSENFSVKDNRGGYLFMVRGDGKVGVATAAPDAALHVNGQLKLTGGSPAAGKILISDANGLATWATPPPTGISLPYCDSASSSSAIFSITNTGGGDGVAGVAMIADKSGVIGHSRATTGYGVWGTHAATSNHGILGSHWFGVLGATNSNHAAVYADARNTTGNNAHGLHAFCKSPNAYAVVAANTGNGFGILGYTESSNRPAITGRNISTSASAPILLLDDGTNMRMQVDNVGGFVVTGSYQAGTIPATGNGDRMMWYPKKSAFRAGYTDAQKWDDANIGNHSIAFGFSTMASGSSSTAMGSNTAASGSYSTAFGYYSNASGHFSTAMGIWSKASGGYATAIGDQTAASGNSSTAMGYHTTASGDYSTAMGCYTTASGGYSTAMGSYVSTNSKNGSFIIGDRSTQSVMSAGEEHRFYGRFKNGYFFYTNSNPTIGAYLAGNASSWASISDSTKKTLFRPADGESILHRFRSFRLGSWNYREQDPRLYRHYGPMAQEWFAAFGHDGIGTIGSDTTLASADVDGVLCIAVQALEKRTAQLRERVEEISALRAQLTTMQAQMQDLTREFANYREQQRETQKPAYVLQTGAGR